jgi:undecaprenyl-phosphate 4-deoxy-4-formamido-L-arabinose transferase
MGSMGATHRGQGRAWRVFHQPARGLRGVPRRFVSIDVLLTWGTQRFTHVTVRHDARTIGTSTYTFRKLVTHAINMMTGFPTIPLQPASLIGFALTGFARGAGLRGGALPVDGGDSAPFPFLACIVSISRAQPLCPASSASTWAAPTSGCSIGRSYVRGVDERRPPP